jgi:hypothetical protein
MPYHPNQSGNNRLAGRHSQHPTDIKFPTNSNRTGSEEEILQETQAEEGTIKKTIEFRVSVRSHIDVQDSDAMAKSIESYQRF